MTETTHRRARAALSLLAGVAAGLLVVGMLAWTLFRVEDTRREADRRACADLIETREVIDRIVDHQLEGDGLASVEIPPDLPPSVGVLLRRIGEASAADRREFAEFADSVLIPPPRCQRDDGP